MGIFKPSKVKFFRSTIATRSNGFGPKKYSSDINIEKELLHSPSLDLSSFQSAYSDQLLWGVANASEVNGNYYSIIVSVSRFLARYALDETFRQEFIADPKNFAIINAEYSVPPEDLYIFTEGTDKRLYRYVGNEKKVDEGHLIAQRLDSATEHIKAIKFDELVNIMKLLTTSNGDMGMRMIGSLYFTVGIKDPFELEYRSVLLEDDGETRSWKRLIDALNISFQECLQIIESANINITEEQLIDIVSRQIAGFLTTSRFNPTLIELDQYMFEVRTREFDLPSIEPDLGLINKHLENTQIK